MKRAIPILFLALILYGCQVKIHPGAVDQFDSATYDTLIVAQSVLDSAKIAFAQGALPAEAKAIINKAGESYNLLRDAWLGYRAAKTEADKGNAKAAVDAAVIAVNQFILDLRKLGVKP
jgi:hypothetical protein